MDPAKYRARMRRRVSCALCFVFQNFKCTILMVLHADVMSLCFSDFWALLQHLKIVALLIVMIGMHDEPKKGQASWAHHAWDKLLWTTILLRFSTQRHISPVLVIERSDWWCSSRGWWRHKISNYHYFNIDPEWVQESWVPEDAATSSS